MNIDQIRESFPQLKEKVYGRQLVYLDNAATSLRPLSVVRKWEEMSLRFNSNLHRAVHQTAVVATEEYESTRADVASFIGAASAEEIVFTSGTTQSINLLAGTIVRSDLLAENDEILVCEAEHHSNIVPWQLVKEHKSLKINILPVNQRGEISLEILQKTLTPRTKLCCVAQISNVLGIVNPIEEMVKICHANGTLVLVDGAQGIVHLPTDVRKMDCDFYAFSGHKMFASPGTGVLYGKRELLEKLPPYMGGGEMIESVSWNNTTFAPVPRRFEAGTQNISGVPTLKPAIEMLKLLRNSEIEQNLKEICEYVSTELCGDPDISLYGIPENRDLKIPLFSFTVKGVHHEDLALILDKMGIATRSGQMCAEPLMDRFGVTGMLRASFAPYNTIQEAEYFIQCLRKAINMLK